MVALDIPPLLSMSAAQIEELYRRSPAGPIPDGPAKGVAIVLPGTPAARVIARLVRLFFWQGKVFEHGQLRNSITIFHVLAIKANVYHGESLLDGGESVILDYSRTSLAARWVRDEIREVAPGVYLGLAYALGRRVIPFVLVFPQRAL